MPKMVLEYSRQHSASEPSTMASQRLSILPVTDGDGECTIDSNDGEMITGWTKCAAFLSVPTGGDVGTATLHR